jgi:hypothetical protein
MHWKLLKRFKSIQYQNVRNFHQIKLNKYQKVQKEFMIQKDIYHLLFL